MSTGMKIRQRGLEREWKQDKKELIRKIEDALWLIEDPNYVKRQRIHFRIDGADFFIKSENLALKWFMKRVKKLYPTTIYQLNKSFSERSLFPRM